MTDSDIATRYQDILAQIREQEHQCGRARDSVALLAVSKTHGIDRIRQAYAAGARAFGENYVGEAVDKIRQLTQGPKPLNNVSWHFIGPIQSNKTRDIANHFDWVHSVDREKIAQRLQDQRPPELPALNVCIQVNLSGEDSKSGVTLDEAAALCTAVSRMPALRLRGLMAIPAPCHDPEQQRITFRPLAKLFQDLKQRFPNMDTLSIGMSDDFAAAIAEGSTMIRVGTAIFGHRN